MCYFVKIENEQGSLKLLLQVEEQEEAQKIFEEMADRLYQQKCIVKLIYEELATLKSSINTSF